jgi:hypothetical protein
MVRPQEDPGEGDPQTYGLHSNPTANSTGTPVAFGLWAATLTKT